MFKNNKKLFSIGVIVLGSAFLASFFLVKNIKFSVTDAKVKRCIDLGSPKARQACEAAASSDTTTNANCKCPGGTGTSCTGCKTGDVVGGSGQIYCATCNGGSSTICASGYKPNAGKTSCVPMTGSVTENDNTPAHTPTPVPPTSTPTLTPSPTPTPTKSPSPTPVCTPTPSHSPKPTKSPSPTPTVTASPTATPVALTKLRICKYNDKNNNGAVDSGEGAMGWSFVYKYQDAEHRVNSGWWKLNGGCVTVDVPVNQWINVAEEGRDKWNLTGIYQDGSWVGTWDYNYIAQAGQVKEVKFLNYYSQDATPTPTPSSTPNWCNGTCGSNYNCQGGYYCYNGYCRNPSCKEDTSCGCGIVATASPKPPVVLGATAPPQLPKTGSNDLAIVAGLFGTMGIGFWLFRRFKLI